MRKALFSSSGTPFISVPIFHIFKVQSAQIQYLFPGNPMSVGFWQVSAVKFMFSKKATKIDEIFTIDLKPTT
jgi:hypothetical protein